MDREQERSSLCSSAAGETFGDNRREGGHSLAHTNTVTSTVVAVLLGVYNQAECVEFGANVTYIRIF